MSLNIDDSKDEGLKLSKFPFGFNLSTCFSKCVNLLVPPRERNRLSSSYLANVSFDFLKDTLPVEIFELLHKTEP